MKVELKKRWARKATAPLALAFTVGFASVAMDLAKANFGSVGGFAPGTQVLTSYQTGALVDATANVAQIFGTSVAPLTQLGQFQGVPQSNGFVANWDGASSTLPGAIPAQSWQRSYSSFDPSFVTSYYSSSKGPLNTASAPWQQGWGESSTIGDAIFQWGTAGISR